MDPACTISRDTPSGSVQSIPRATSRHPQLTVVIVPGRVPTSAIGYRSPYTDNRDTAPQINTHSPSENNSTQISASPGLNLRVGSPPELPDDDDPCEPRQQAKEQNRWTAAFCPNAPPSSEENASLHSPRHFPGAISHYAVLLECDARKIGSAWTASGHCKVGLFTR
jgi:hypothetical protein